MADRPASRRRASSAPLTPAALWGRRAVIGVVAVGLLVFGLVGGEYDVQDLLERTKRRAALDAEVARLTLVRDSLTVQLERLANDPATLERVAREEFGMVRGDKELLYRFAEAEEPTVDGLTDRPGDSGRPELMPNP